jgi:uncharacterized protein (DUF3084 family)
MRGVVILLGLAVWFGAIAPSAAYDDAELAAWREQLDRAEAQLANAQSRANAAEAAYVNMRHDRSVRGDDKAKVLAERTAAQRNLTTAQTDLETLREEARRAGAPPQWVLPDSPAEDAD